MHPLHPGRTLSGALAGSRTPPPKSLFSAEGGWEEVEAKAAQTMERKSECGQLRVCLAGRCRGRRGPGVGLDCPSPRSETPTSSGAVGVFRGSPLTPRFSYPLSLPLDCFFPTFSSPGLTRFCPRSPPSLPAADLRQPVTFPSPSGSYPHQAFHNDTSRKVGRFKSTMKWSLFNPVLSSLGKCSNTVRFQRALLMRRACQVYQLQPP